MSAVLISDIGRNNGGGAADYFGTSSTDQILVTSNRALLDADKVHGNRDGPSRFRRVFASGLMISTICWAY